MVVVSSTFWLAVFFPCDLGCCRLLWNCFGHDRAKKDSWSCFSPVKALIAGLLHARSGLSLDYIGVVNEGLMCCIKLVCLGTTQKELEGWISSPQPLNSIGREVKACGTLVEKGRIPCVGCVWVS